MPESAVEVRTEAVPHWDETIACSGTGHFSGVDQHLHGDPSQPAEWLVKQKCPSCGHTQNRPVCDFFKEHGLEPERMITCSACAFQDSAAIFFKVLHRL